jgi:hypothetical protein
MAKRIKIPFLGSKYDKPSAKDVSVQNLVNFYLEEVPDITQNNTQLIAIGRPGTSKFCTVNASGANTRGTFQHKDVGYTVVDDTVYSVTSGGVAASLGTLAGSTGRVSISAINDEIVFADGAGDPRRYKVSTANFATISDADLPDNVKHVIAANEYMLFIKPSSGTVYSSAVSDTTSITATHFFTAESNYDNLKSGTYNKGLVYLFGDVTSEIWLNDGGTQGAPFVRASDGVLPFGIAAEYAHAIVLDQVYLLAKNEQGVIGVVSISGGQYRSIQNRDLVEKIGAFNSYNDAFGWTYSVNGHHFFCLTFPSAESTRGRTFSYDVTTGAWNELQCMNPDSSIGPTQDQFIANCSMLLGGKQIVGHYQSGILYMLDNDVFEDFEGDTTQYEIRGEATGAHITNNGEFFSVSNVEIDVEGGVGLDDDVQGSDPQIGLSYSKDRGHTFSNVKWRDMGRLGEYHKRILWGSTGGGYSWTPKVIITDPVRRVILGMTAVLN